MLLVRGESHFQRITAWLDYPKSDFEASKWHKNDLDKMNVTTTRKFIVLNVTTANIVSVDIQVVEFERRAYSRLCLLPLAGVITPARCRKRIFPFP